ncbi:cupin domain-containing protein [Rhodosalinus sp. K401]|uniref:cupin domain-containing protein n=1 Tax=Rhodosalinus sp. K401 TaxID=3239195 RepID=UPI0035269C5F
MTGRKINRSNSEHYVWADVCDGWRLLDGQDLSVIDEEMPPGAREIRHVHAHANQLFFVLHGTLTIEIEGDMVHLSASDACNVKPGQKHQAQNASRESVRFLVISAPTTRGDREPAPRDS